VSQRQRNSDEGDGEKQGGGSNDKVKRIERNDRLSVTRTTCVDEQEKRDRASAARRLNRDEVTQL